MRVFVAGASGVLGRATVPLLVAAGHEVTGMTRSAEKANGIREAGADAIVCDVYEAERLREGVATAAPEVVVNLLTALPQRYNRRGDWLEATNRLRFEGTRNLVAAARAAGARRLVAESIAFAYRAEGERVKDEGAPIEDRSGPGVAVADMERQVLESRLDGVVLRYGFLYGPGTHFDRGNQEAVEVERRRFPIVGAGTGTFSFLHAADAGVATLAAVERGAPGAYNVVDDEPAPVSEWLPVYAAALGAKPPRRVPVWLARLAAGREIAEGAIELRGASNAKAKRELGWEPSHPSWREGFAEALS
jgi:nucleoside-diphosphate-sugar epimerase